MDFLFSEVSPGFQVVSERVLSKNIHSKSHFNEKEFIEFISRTLGPKIVLEEEVSESLVESQKSKEIFYRDGISRFSVGNTDYSV